MATFTHMVETIAKEHELETKKAIAGHIGCNPSTLGSALKNDTKDSPYTGSLVEPVTEKYEAVTKPKKKSSSKRKAPRGRLGRLRKSGDTSWSAELKGESIEIERDENRHWTATNPDGDLVADDSTFKGIITKLREIAASA